METET